MDHRTKGIAFEQYVRQILENAGIQTQSTIASNDYGADILFYYLGYYFVVQCKCLSGAAGIKPVQEVIGAISYYHAHYGIVVTNTFFTQQASRLCLREIRDIMTLSQQRGCRHGEITASA